MRSQSESAMEWLVPCPDPYCDAPAEIMDRITLGSTDGPVEFLKTQCLARHFFALPVDRAYPSRVRTPAPGRLQHSETGLTG